MTTYSYNRAARPWPQFLPRVESLRPDRLVRNAKVSIPGRGSGVRLSANLINAPEGHGSTVTVRSRVRPAISTGGISMLSSVFRSDLLWPLSNCMSVPSAAGPRFSSDRRPGHDSKLISIEIEPPIEGSIVK